MGTWLCISPSSCSCNLQILNEATDQMSVIAQQTQMSTHVKQLLIANRVIWICSCTLAQISQAVSSGNCLSGKPAYRRQLVADKTMSDKLGGKYPVHTAQESFGGRSQHSVSHSQSKLLPTFCDFSRCKSLHPRVWPSAYYFVLSSSPNHMDVEFETANINLTNTQQQIS